MGRKIHRYNYKYNSTYTYFTFLPTVPWPWGRLSA